MAKKTTAESIARRWTPRLVESGFIPVSTYFIENYHRLQPKMTPAEAMLIIHLVKHKWDERNPHPSFASLAKRMGLSSTAVRNHARALEKKHYLKRIPVHGQANEFDLSPLFDSLERLLMADEEKRSKLRPVPVPMKSIEQTVRVRPDVQEALPSSQPQPDEGQEQGEPGSVLINYAELEQAIRDLPDKDESRLLTVLLGAARQAGEQPAFQIMTLTAPHVLQAKHPDRPEHRAQRVGPLLDRLPAKAASEHPPDAQREGREDADQD